MTVAQPEINTTARAPETSPSARDSVLARLAGKVEEFRAQRKIGSLTDDIDRLRTDFMLWSSALLPVAGTIYVAVASLRRGTPGLDLAIVVVAVLGLMSNGIRVARGADLELAARIQVLLVTSVFVLAPVFEGQSQSPILVAWPVAPLMASYLCGRRDMVCVTLLGASTILGITTYDALQTSLAASAIVRPTTQLLTLTVVAVLVDRHLEIEKRGRLAQHLLADSLLVLVDENAEGMAVFDADGECIFSNQAAARVLSENDLPPTASPEESSGAWVPGQQMVRRVQNSGDEQTLAISVQEISWNQAPHTLVAMHDISEREAAIEELEHQRQLYKTLCETIPESIWLTDAEGRLEYLSPHAATLFGQATPTPGARPWHWLRQIDPRDRKSWTRGWRHALVHKNHHHGQIRATNDRAEELTLDFVARRLPHRHPDDRPGWVGVHIDVSESVRTASSLAHYASELLRSNVELEQFASLASHDLQEPLRKITAFSDLLVLDLGGQLPEAAARDLEFITDAATRMRALIQASLRLAKLGRELDCRITRIDDVIDGALTDISAPSGVQLSIERSIMPTCTVDRQLLVRVYQNLLTNALRFRQGEHCRIRLTAERATPDAPWILGVHDDGHGMDADQLERIFLPFKRTGTKREGLGVGLAITRKIVQAHGGRIWAESAGRGQGARFYFTLGDPSEAPPRLEVNHEHAA